MRSVEEQQAKVAAAAVAPRPVRVAIAEAQGLMCAEEVINEQPLPGFDQAAIDGYAVRSVDVLGVGGDAEDGGGEISLPVMGVIEAGTRTPSRLQPKQAARVQTGAPMPTLADAVLPLRWTDGGQTRVRVLRDGKEVYSAPARLVEMKGSGRAVFGALKLTDKMTPGEYNLQVIAAEQTGKGDAAGQWTDFTVLP